MSKEKEKLLGTAAQAGLSIFTDGGVSFVLEKSVTAISGRLNDRRHRKLRAWSEQLLSELGVALEQNADSEVRRLLKNLEMHPEAEEDLLESVESVLNARSQTLAPRILALLSAKVLHERKPLDATQRAVMEAVQEFTDAELLVFHKYVSRWRNLASRDFSLATTTDEIFFLDGEDRCERARQFLTNSFVDWSGAYGAWAGKAERYGLVAFHVRSSTWAEEHEADGSPRTSKAMRVFITEGARLLSEWVEKARQPVEKL